MAEFRNLVHFGISVQIEMSCSTKLFYGLKRNKKGPNMALKCTKKSIGLTSYGKGWDSLVDMFN